MPKPNRQILCEYCHEPILQKDKVVLYGKYYHRACLREHEAESKAKHDDSSQVQNEIVEAITKYYRISEPTSLMWAQLRRYSQNSTLNGILYTIIYYFSILKNEPEVKYGIGFVPNYYEEAKEFYLDKYNLKLKMDKVNNFKIEEVKYKPNHRKKHKNFLIDIENI